MKKIDRIHKYDLNDVKIVLDVNSGAVHIVDSVVYDILDDYTRESFENIEAKLDSKYDRESIRRAYREIQILENDGLLYSDSTEFENIKYNEDNIIKALCLHVAHDCNLRCEYCFASQGDFDGDRSVMDFETGKKAFDLLVENSGNRRNLEVDFFGGEPLMNFELVKQLVEYGYSLEEEHDKNFRFTITTNGILLDDDKIDFINEHMSNVVLSLDGRKEVNDNMRPTISGDGSYDIIVPKFKKLIEKRGDKEYYIRGTFTSNNLDFSNDALDFYDQGFKKISIEPVVTDPSLDYAIGEEHLDRIKKEYEDFSKEYIKIKKNDDEFLFFHYMIDLEQGPCLAKRAVGCGAGSEYIAITPEGDIYPCHQFVGNEDFIIGNVDGGIVDTSLRDGFKNANVYNKEECRDCWAKFYCSGGCHANAYHTHGDIMRAYEIGCEMEKKRIECAISILANLI